MFPFPADTLVCPQEPYMEVVNPFILKNKERMVVFLDQLSAIGDPGTLPAQQFTSSGSSAATNIDTG